MRIIQHSPKDVHDLCAESVEPPAAKRKKGAKGKSAEEDKKWTKWEWNLRRRLRTPRVR